MSIAFVQVAINDYEASPLSGCRHDAENLFAEIAGRDLPVRYNHRLFDKEAKAMQIRQALAELIVQPQDVLIFQQSSHGSYLPDLNHDEGRWQELQLRPDPQSGPVYDQCLVPYDYEDRGMIIDDELGAFSDLVPSNTTFVIWLDSCYSGGSTRAGGRLFDKVARTAKLDRPRSLPIRKVTPEVIAATREASAATREFAKDTKKRRLRQRGDGETFIHYTEERSILIASAQCDHTAADAYIDGTWQGAGTRAMIEAWKILGNEATYVTVVIEANRWLEQKGYDQRVQLEGIAEKLHRPFLT